MIDKLKYNIFLFEIEIEIIFSSTVFCGLGENDGGGGTHLWGQNNDVGGE